MSYSLNDDQRQIQDLIHRVAKEKVAARAEAIDRTAEYPEDMDALLKELGRCTLPFPHEYGRIASMLSACLAVEELGRVCYNTAYLLVVQWIPFGAIDHATGFIQNRMAFGQPISDFQGVRWMIADIAMHTEAARHLVYRAASLVDAGVTGSELAPVASVVKRFATDAAMKVATDAVKLIGASGVSAEFPINRYFRDAKVLQIIEGTNQITAQHHRGRGVGQARKAMRERKDERTSSEKRARSPREAAPQDHRDDHWRAPCFALVTGLHRNQHLIKECTWKQ
jgi:alkylation response protein AidB-like acyl-CoA dehydrogenase